MRRIMRLTLKSPERRFSWVPFILGINAIVFLQWQGLLSEKLNLNFMIQNFLVSGTALEQGRYWTLWTSAFSHNGLIHFLVNMLVLNSFGPIVEMTIGPWRFIKFYLIASAISSLGHVFVSYTFLGQPGLPALGASGALAGVVALFAFMYPREKLLLFGLIPVPALIGLLIFVGLDLWGVVAQAEGGGLPIGHGAHLGGAIFGILYYYGVIRPARKAMLQSP